MVGTQNRLETLREELEQANPGWQARLRAELDILTPGWEDFPIEIWDESQGVWTTVILLAKPETVTGKRVGVWGAIRRWIKR